MTTKEDKKSLLVWLDKEVLKDLKQLALDKETNVSAIVREAINKELKNKNN